MSGSQLFSRIRSSNSFLNFSDIFRSLLMWFRRAEQEEPPARLCSWPGTRACRGSRKGFLTSRLRSHHLTPWTIQKGVRGRVVTPGLIWRTAAEVIHVGGCFRRASPWLREPGRGLAAGGLRRTGKWHQCTADGTMSLRLGEGNLPQS